MSPASRLVSAVLVIVSFGLMVLVLAEWLIPIGTTGVAVVMKPDGARISALRDPAAAGAADVRVGDRIDLHALSVSERVRLFAGTVAGDIVHVRVAHPNGAFHDAALGTVPSQTLVDALDGRLSASRTAQLLAIVSSALIALAVAALIGWRRPSVAAAALLFSAIAPIDATRTVAFLGWIPNPLFGAVALAIGTLFAQLPAYAMLVFLAWFPAAPRTPGERRRARWAVGLFAGALAYELARALTFRTGTPLAVGLEEAAPWIAMITVLTFTVVTYAAAAGEVRRRIAWVLAAVVVSSVALSLNNAVQFLPADMLSPDGRHWSYAMLSTLQTSFFVVLAYAVLRHRVLDLGFVLNRTLVYGVVTTLVVVIVSVVDWLCGHFLVATRFTLVLEAVVAVALGLVLNRLHGATERIVDRIVFRQRHLAETRLRQRATALTFAQDEADIDSTLACDACTILGLSSGAVFRRDPDAVGYRRMAVHGWDGNTVSAIEGGSILVRSLLTENGLVILDDLAIDNPGLPIANARPALAVPIFFQADLLGFALYGPHPDGTLPDPEELELLRHLATSAGSVYEVVELRRWRRSVLSHRAIAAPYASGSATSPD